MKVLPSLFLLCSLATQSAFAGELPNCFDDKNFEEGVFQLMINVKDSLRPYRTVKNLLGYEPYLYQRLQLSLGHEIALFVSAENVPGVATLLSKEEVRQKATERLTYIAAVPGVTVYCTNLVKARIR